MSSTRFGATTVPDAGMIGEPIPYVDLAAQFNEQRDTILPAIVAALARGDYVGGEAVAQLESELSSFFGGFGVVTCNSGTDALLMSLLALGIGRGDEVITPVNSFVASTSVIVHVGATPVLVDVLDDQNIDPDAVERAVTPKTKAIMPVHLTGRVCDMPALRAIAERHGLAIIEDAAQAIGSRLDGQLAGTFGDGGCFSAHPLKNLGAVGDAGFLVLRDETICQRLRRYRTHGMKDRDTIAEFGIVSRMDTLQAVVLLERLKLLPSVISRRRRNAAIYQVALAPEIDAKRLFVPPCRENELNTFHTFVIQVERRDELKSYLGAHGIGTAIHYPTPIHLQPAAAKLGYPRGSFPVAERQASRILTLPVRETMREDDVYRVVECIRRFFAQ